MASSTRAKGGSASNAERRAALGELVQIDGSLHAWLENVARVSRCWFLSMTRPVWCNISNSCRPRAPGPIFDAARSYIQQHGKPCAFYSDQLGVFKVNAKEVLNGRALTQFGRVMRRAGHRPDLRALATSQGAGFDVRMNQNASGPLGQRNAIGEHLRHGAGEPVPTRLRRKT